jgi:hypothetical protein
VTTERFDLSRNGRQIWWWGIYLFGSTVGSLVLMAWMRGQVFSSFWAVLLLPFGLDYDFSFLCESLSDRLGLAPVEYAGANLYILIGLPIAYLIFIIHYRLTSEAKTRREFFLLMLGLGLLICAGLIGLAKAPPAIRA